MQPSSQLPQDHPLQVAQHPDIQSSGGASSQVSLGSADGPEKEPAMHDLIVIGGGPAGLAATTYALGKGLDVGLIATRLGGRAGDRQHYVGQGGPEALVGEEAALSLQRYLTAHPQHLLESVVVDLRKEDNLFFVRTEETTWSSRAVIIATGAKPRMLGLPSEWRSIGLGVAYSITTHAHAVAGRDVAVVGATPRALLGIAELVQLAHSIALIAPDPGALASPLGQRLQQHPQVRLLDGWHVQEIEAAGGSVQAIVVVREGSTLCLPVQAVFVELGLIPNSQLVPEPVSLDAARHIVVDEQNRTTLPGLFAAGDVTNRACEQILIAIGEGTRAAVSAYAYVLAQRLGIEVSAVGAG
jgi:thioredoxin reductase